MGKTTHAYYGKANTTAIIIKTKWDSDQDLSLVMRNSDTVSLWSCSNGQVFTDTNSVTFNFTDSTEKTITIYANRDNIQDIFWALNWKATFLDLSRCVSMERVNLSEVGNPDFTNLIMPLNTDTLIYFIVDGINIV